MKKGFTLIELLAVIVILAIIALIATPIILNIISNAKKEVDERSIDLYASAVKNAIAKYQLKENKTPTNFNEIESYIKYDGAKIECETKEIYSNGKIYLDGCKVENKEVNYVYGEKQDQNNMDSEISEVNHLANKNVHPATEATKTTGKVPSVDSNGDFLPGSEFIIKVSDSIGELTFFVLSNDGEYVNLIAQKNLAPDGTLAGEDQIGDDWYVTSENSYDNRYGPQTAYTYLSSATSNWKNIPIIESFTYSDAEDQPDGIKHTYGYQGITTTLDSESGNYITTITPLSSDYGNPVTYENMRARLPYYKEIISNTSCENSSGSCAKESLWVTDYLLTSKYVSGGTSLNTYSYGYWLLATYSNGTSMVRHVYASGGVVNGAANYSVRGIRPVITILKSDLLRVM